MFAYCENNPINNHDSNGDFCIASAIVGEVLNAGLAVAGAYIDSLISGESVKGSDLAVDVIVAFASGFIQGGFSVKWISAVKRRYFCSEKEYENLSALCLSHFPLWERQ